MNVLKMQRLPAAAVLIAVVLCGCASTQPIPIPELSHPKSSGLAIDVSVKPPLSLFGNQLPDQIYFAKIDGEDGLLQKQVIRSNYSRDGRVYLLNAHPGVYVVVATVKHATPGTRDTSTYTTYFSNELVEQTRVTVQEGDFIFIGRYVVGASLGFAGADGIQTHYNNVIASGAIAKGFLQFGEVDFRYRGALLERKIDEQTHNEFVRKAKEDLAGSGWPTRLR